jgi:hypothetical protein
MALYVVKLYKHVSVTFNNVLHHITINPVANMPGALLLCLWLHSRFHSVSNLTYHSMQIYMGATGYYSNTAEYVPRLINHMPGWA